jgi:3-hydroxyisobutyrate dehydrogenase
MSAGDCGSPRLGEEPFEEAMSMNSTPISPQQTKIGWIGTGLMGSSMCGHLIGAGYSVTVTTRTRARAQPLLDRGATWASSAAEVADSSDVIVSMVGSPADVRDVILGPQGALAAAASESVVVDMTTSEPYLAQEIHAFASEQEVASIDAPVSGGDVGARQGTLSIMVGGDEAPVGRVWPLFEVLGSTIVHQGGPGAGQHTKMVNQVLIAAGMIGLSEAFLYARRSGLELESVMRSVGAGAAASWSLSNYGPRMLQGDFEPGFAVDHFIKDMDIALSEAGRMSLSMPGAGLAHELYVALKAHGGGQKGIHALLVLLARLSDIEWTQSAADPHETS